MIYLLDTTSLSRIMREDVPMDNWLKSIRSEDQVITCTIARGEILFGIRRLAPGGRRDELEAKATRLFVSVRCEAVPATTADHYADLRCAQMRRGLPLGENDLWIAATALAMNATLVSSDSDFARIDGLALISP